MTIGAGATRRQRLRRSIRNVVDSRARARIGDRVILQNGVVIGGDGYGFVRRGDGTHEKIPQVAVVVIEDDVELGANTTVDRPAVGETRIKAGTKIDNLVQIGHGVTVGRNVLMAAQVGIAGSTDVEDDVVFGGQVGVGGHLTIGRGAIAVGQSGVTNSLDAGRMRRRLSGDRQPRLAQGLGPLPAPAGAEAPHRSSSKRAWRSSRAHSTQPERSSE